MDIVNRAKNICLTPNTEWSVIAAEATTPATLITEYVVPLAAIGAVAGFIGGSILGMGLGAFGVRTSLVAGLTLAVFSFVMAIVGCFIVAFVVNALAPTFGGEKNSTQALKVVVYSYTPAFIAGVLRILPIFGGLLAFLAALYGLYLLYLGLPRLMKAPQDKSIGYTIVVVVCTIVLYAVVTVASGIMIGGAALGGGLLSGAFGSPRSTSSDVQFDKNSPLGKLQDLGAKLEESNKKMEAAQKSGDANAQAAAAIESLGTLLGGGKRVDPISIDELKPFVPDTFAGLPRRSINVAKTGMAMIMVSKAEATYGDGAGKDVKLEITDTGGMSGMVGLVSWMGMSEEKDNEFSSERTRKVNGRYVHEKISKRGGENEFGIVLGERFIVGASGNVPPDQLRAGLDSLDLAKLEGMKGTGVQR
jgi:Yip1 domain